MLKNVLIAALVGVGAWGCISTEAFAEATYCYWNNSDKKYSENATVCTTLPDASADPAASVSMNCHSSVWVPLNGTKDPTYTAKTCVKGNHVAPTFPH